MPESPDAARLQQIRAAVTETGWWRMTRPDVELLVAEINRQEAVIARALALLDGWDWDQSRSGGDNSAIPAAIAVLSSEAEEAHNA